MKIQTGLQKLTKRYFELLSGNDNNGWEEMYKEVDEKYHNVLRYEDEGGEHPDLNVWQSLWEATCTEVCRVRKLNAA